MTTKEAGGGTCLADSVPRASAGPADLVVTVRADRGPRGAASPVAVDRRLVSTTIADWRPQDYVPAPSPTFVALLNALRPGVLRWPAGHRSQEYVWAGGGGGQTGTWTLAPVEVDAFMALTKSVSAEPLIAINVKRGTIAAAKDLLRYLNVEKKYGVKWLQLGNEPDLGDGLVSSPEAYATKLVEYVDALRSVDPTIRVVAPEIMTGAHIGGMHGTVDWMGRILASAGSHVDAISWHYYPLDSGQPDPSSSATLSVERLFQETAPDWRPAATAFVDEVMPALAALRAKHAPSAEIWITEMAEDPGPMHGAGVSDRLAGALWVADVLGRYAEHAPGAVLRWFWKSDEHAYALVDDADRPRPTYGALWLYARHLGNRFVDAQSSALFLVGAHAALRADGALTVVLVNKTAEPRRVHLDVRGFHPCRGDAMNLTGTGFVSSTFAINGQTLTAGNAVQGIEPIALDPATLLDLEVPATSIRVLAYRPD